MMELAGSAVQFTLVISRLESQWLSDSLGDIPVVL